MVSINRILSVIALALVVSLSSPGYSQSPETINSITYKAYVIGDINLWQKAISQAEAEYSSDSGPDKLLQLVNVQYGYISYCLSESNKKMGQDMLEAAYKNLETLIGYRPDDPEIIALHASLVAFEMNISPFKMASLGPRAVRLTDQAYSLDSNNLMALTCKANQLNFTPKIFGGSTTEAIPLYNTIITLYENNTLEPENDWRYINTMVILASTYEKEKQYDKACRVYEKIIASDPSITWINNKLYPECLIKAEAGKK